jgi:DNA-binding PadR family transcriptional regulator
MSSRHIGYPAGVDDLPTTAWAVLGLLSFGRELSGYELRKWADASIRFFYGSPAMSQIYRELRRLEARGYVTARPAPPDEPRRKRLYTITPAGLDALRVWLREAPVEPPVLKHGAALRVWLGHLSDPATLRRTVEEHRDRAAELAAEVGKARAVAEHEPTWTYPAVIERWGERYWEAERDAAEALLADLDATVAAPASGASSR